MLRTMAEAKGGEIDWTTVPLTPHGGTDHALFTKTWFMAFAEAAELAPEAPALLCYTPGSTRPTRSVSFGELLGMVEALAAALASTHGITVESVVGLNVAREQPEYAALVFACSKLGAFALPLDPSYPEQRLRDVAMVAGAQVVVHDSSVPIFAADARGVAVSLLMSTASSAVPLSQKGWCRDPSLGGMIFSSSGSTGTPKLIKRRQVSLQSSVMARFFVVVYLSR